MEDKVKPTFMPKFIAYHTIRMREMQMDNDLNREQKMKKVASEWNNLTEEEKNKFATFTKETVQ